MYETTCMSQTSLLCKCSERKKKRENKVSNVEKC